MITCDDLSHPDNGRVTLKGGSAVNSIAEYTCNEGFQLDGDSLRFCRLNGTWTEYPPVCVEGNITTLYTIVQSYNLIIGI